MFDFDALFVFDVWIVVRQQKSVHRILHRSIDVCSRLVYRVVAKGEKDVPHPCVGQALGVTENVFDKQDKYVVVVLHSLHGLDDANPMISWMKTHDHTLHKARPFSAQ